MKQSKIIIVLLVLFFCVGSLAPPVSALDRDPNQPRLDRPPGDDTPWGNEQASTGTSGNLKYNNYFHSIPYLYGIEILFHLKFGSVQRTDSMKRINNVRIIHISNDREIRTNTQTYSR